MINCAFFIFLSIGFIEGLLLILFRTQIFDYNSELGFNTVARKSNRRGEIVDFLKDKRLAYHESPFAQKIWVATSIFLSVILGWILLWFLLDRRLNYFLSTNITWEDLALFLLAYIGISGRLQIIAESVQQWFKR